MKKTLLIMAAGMASRYGGGKQTDGMGPSGEYIMEYSINDARKHGFNKLVFIIGPTMLDEFPRDIASRVKDIEIEIAVQDFSTLPSFYKVPEGRTKPYGTVHAVLAAKKYLTEPFLVINADDLYGEQAYIDITGHIDELQGTENTACMLEYPIGSTLSGYGEVTRGICNIENGILTGVEEVYSIKRDDEGVIRSYKGDVTEPLCENAPASMNIFGFTPSVLELFEQEFENFLKQEHENPLKCEYVLPTMINSLISQGKLTMRVYHTDSEWYGVTYREDRAIVSEMLKSHPLR